MKTNFDGTFTISSHSQSVLLISRIFQSNFIQIIDNSHMARRSDTRKSIQAKRDYAFLKPKDSMSNDIFLYNVHSLHTIIAITK